MLNPSLADDMNTQDEAAAPSDKVDEQANTLASLIQSSTLLKSYEQLMAQYEEDNERKQKAIGQLERDQQQLLHENNALSEQLYQLKAKQISGGAPEELGEKREEDLFSFDVGDRVQKDKMVELLRRNHDVMMEKYEVFRQRNEFLEKSALEKEALYVGMKAESEKLADQLFHLRREKETLAQEKQILEARS